MYSENRDALNMDDKTYITIDPEKNFPWPKNMPKDSKNPELKTMLSSEKFAK